jgi:hypothetical protein
MRIEKMRIKERVFSIRIPKSQIRNRRVFRDE